ncbi:MAG: hypothetical protein M3O20_16220 [Acidobacteriota bacterium]|nr:hypothetical protein [Acidobacteriota bacterium]
MTVKTSTIFIAKSGGTQVYRSVAEIPDGLRKELEESTNSFNSATILIADRRGREEIVKALNGLPSSLRSRLANSLTPRAEAEAVVAAESRVAPVLRFLRKNWLEVTLPTTVAVIVWAAFNFR